MHPDAPGFSQGPAASAPGADPEGADEHAPLKQPSLADAAAWLQAQKWLLEIRSPPCAIGRAKGGVWPRVAAQQVCVLPAVLFSPLMSMPRGPGPGQREACRWYTTKQLRHRMRIGIGSRRLEKNPERAPRRRGGGSGSVTPRGAPCLLTSCAPLVFATQCSLLPRRTRPRRCPALTPPGIR